MLDKIMARVLMRRMAKKAAPAFMENQRKLEQYYEGRQKQREKRWDAQMERAIYHAYPPMASSYAAAAVGWKYLLGFIVVGGIAILLYIIHLSVLEIGLTDTFREFAEMIEACSWYHGVAFLLCILFFMGLFAVSPMLIKYVENTETIFTSERVFIKRYLRKDRIVSYDEIGECIRRRKISIKNGRYYIPYKGGSIAISIVEGEFPADLFMVLEKKCNINLPGWDINCRGQRTGMGWAISVLGGGIMFAFSLFIWVIIFLSEGVFTWERAVFDFFVNPMLLFTAGVIILGLLFRIYFWPSTFMDYGKYKDVMRVSITPLFVDMVIIWILIGGFLRYGLTGW